MAWYVYIIEMQDGRFYTGITNDIDRRISEHKDGKGGHFTSAFKFGRLLYTEECIDKSTALKRERQIQGWTRRKKSALINGNLDLLKKL